VSLAMHIAPSAITLGVMNEKRYGVCLIKSFKDEATEKLFRGQFSRTLPQDIQRVAARKLEQLQAATITILDTLRVPPGNRLEALAHDRQGQHSIRVNDQWRVCVVWRDGNAYDVEIVA
jgi:proteic killer suppression protein